MFFQIGYHLKTIAGASEYIVDSFPVAVCHNIRISRSKILKGKQYRGFTASMRQYFYGVKVQVLTTAQGIAVEFCFVPGEEHDVVALHQLPLDVAPESVIYGDSAFTDYDVEDIAMDAEAIRLMIQRKCNSKRPDAPWIRFIKEQMRKRIETSFSCIKNLFPRSIHAVTDKGLLLKVVLFIVAYTFEKLYTN